MNLGIVISYIIAGMILLSIAMMNIRVQNSTAELTITQIVREHVVSITDILNDDLPNMGYDVNRTTLQNDDVGNRILHYANANRIRFYRNLSNDPTRTPDRITWELIDDNPASGNPNIKTLARIVEFESAGTPDTTKIRLGVTEFQLRYYDTVGAPLSSNMSPPGSGLNLSDVKQIHVVLEVQSREPVYNRATGPGRFVRTVWDKRFTPSNLN
jgi:hypothetical protein